MADLLFYLSFCDIERPKGKQWLGAMYVEADTLITAVQRAWDLGENPGGQIMSLELPLDAPVKTEYRHRLLNEEQLRLAGPDTKLQRMNGEVF